MASLFSKHHHCTSLPSLLILILVGTLVFISLPGESDAQRLQPKRSKIKFCKLDVFLECFFESMHNFTHTPAGTGVPLTAADFEQWCFSLHDFAPYCTRLWLRKCASPIHEDAVDGLLLKPLQESLREFCDDSTIRKEWLTLSQCIIHRVKLGAAYRSRCIRRLQGNSEFVHYAFYRHKSSPRFWRHFCCVYNDWEDCIVDELTKECGSGAGVIFSRLIHGGSLGLLSGLCTRSAFNPNDELQCVPEDTQAPAQYVPKGLHSTSLVSWLFSYACPNVGWGIYPKKDFK